MVREEAKSRRIPCNLMGIIHWKVVGLLLVACCLEVGLLLYSDFIRINYRHKMNTCCMSKPGTQPAFVIFVTKSTIMLAHPDAGKNFNMMNDRASPGVGIGIGGSNV